MEFSHLRLSLVLPFLVILGTMVACGLTSHPSDQELEQQLRSHTAEFDKLVSMLREDSDVVRLDSKHVFLSKTSKRTISEYRLNEYRRLFKKLGLEGGVHRYESEVIRFIASTEGMFVPSSEKSFVHSTIELTPQVNSLDDVANQESTSQQPVYKKVFGNWYLYYESW